jgi:hypothetical protein
MGGTSAVAGTGGTSGGVVGSGGDTSATGGMSGGGGVVGSGGTSGGSDNAGTGAVSGSGAVGSGGVNGSGGSSGSGGIAGSVGVAGGGGSAGSGVTAGTGGSAAGTGGAPPVCQDGATQPCCQGGHQTCSGGVWGACQGARISAETCNGVDDDCNGQIDDVGTVSCGVGACATTVSACGANGSNSCVPLAPSTSFDGCDGIDNDCDGAVDEDCSSCVRVAPNGDDTAAAGDNNATPFANVQAAIDFAATHPSGASRVCVAGGATCQASATYNGPTGSDLTMRDGIDVFANYESTGWTRCTAPNTTLAPQTPLGVSFPASITSPTTLDGFSIVRSIAGTSTAAVTVDGATHVVLSNLVVPKNATIANAYGIVLQNGAEALVYRSRIEVANGYGTTETIGIKSVGSLLYLENSSGADAAGNTPPCAATGNGVVLSMSGPSGGMQRGVLLESSPGSVIEDSDVCATPYSNDTTQNARVAAVEIHGDATGIVLHGDRLTSMPYGGTPRATLAMTDCGAATPWIAGNTITIQSLESAPVTVPESIYAAGDCRPRIDSNPSISATTNTYATALHCGTQGGIDSQCIISHNAKIGVNIAVPSTGGPAFYTSGTGVQCDGTACARIDQNQIQGVAQATYSGSCSLNVTGDGLVLSNSAALVAANVIVGNNSSTLNSDGIGVSSGGAARIENNYISGSNIAAGYNQCLGVKTIIGLSVSGPADVDSNSISSGFNACWAEAGIPSASGRYGYGVDAGAGSTFRNNALGGCVSFREYSTNADPVVFQNNDMPGGYLDEGTNYPNADFSDPRLGATQVNALTDMTTGGNIDAACFTGSTDGKHLAAGSACIDAGTSTGAPFVDYDGQARDAHPDIGPDEYVP